METSHRHIIRRETRHTEEKMRTSRDVARNRGAVLTRTSENPKNQGELWDDQDPPEKSAFRRVVRKSKTWRQEWIFPEISDGTEMPSRAELIDKIR